MLVLMLVSVGVGFVHSRISGQVEQSRLRVQQMEADIKQFKPQLDQVAAFRKKKASLEKKIGIIDGLARGDPAGCGSTPGRRPDP